jgi:hypothetical protein
LVAIGVTGAFLAIALTVTMRHGAIMLALIGVAVMAVAYAQATQGAVPSAVKHACDVVLVLGLVPIVHLWPRLTSTQRRAGTLTLLLIAISACAGVLGGGGLRLAVIGIWQGSRWLGAIRIGVLISFAL